MKPSNSSPTMVRSGARSQAPSKSPTHVSRSPTSVSKAPTQVSRGPTTVSRAPTTAPTQVSRAPSQQSVVRAPRMVSRAPAPIHQQPQPPQIQAVTSTAPTGDLITSIITEARNTINVARELVNQVRPALDSSNSAPNLPTARRTVSDPVSHQSSDTIVGTLLGVAAGAALHYAYTKATETKPSAVAAPPPPPIQTMQFDDRPNLQRTATAPSLTYEDERRFYYHDYAYTRQHQPYAIEAPPTENAGSQASSRHSQRYITMYDTDERLSEVAPTAVTGCPRRRSSFSVVDARSVTSQSRASKHEGDGTRRMLEAPPTSYRAPTAITATDSHASGRSRSKSRIGSVLRAASIGSSRRSSKHGSDEDLRSSTRSRTSRRDDGASRTSRRTSMSKSRAPSVAGSEARTVVPAKPPTIAPSQASKTPITVSKAPTSASKAPTSASKATTIKPEQTPLPASRAGTTVSASLSEYLSTHSKSHKTVIGKMLERDRAESGRGLTKSVVGKLEDVRGVNVTDEEVDPSDSVSQVSSVKKEVEDGRFLTVRVIEEGIVCRALKMPYLERSEPECEKKSGLGILGLKR